MKELQMRVYSWGLDHERVIPVWLSLWGVKIMAKKSRNFRDQNILVIIIFSYTSYIGDVDLSAICALPYKYLYCLSSVVRLMMKESNMLLIYNLNSKFDKNNYAIIHHPLITHYSHNYVTCNGQKSMKIFFATYSCLLH
jgi:hypothetical protein